MSTARSAIRQAVAKLMDEAITGVPDTNLAVGTFGCAALAVYENDYFTDWHGRFYAGTHKDTNFIVTDFVKTAGVVTFVPALGSAVVAGDLFELYPEFKAEEFNTAINLAISMVEKEALQDKLDASLETVESTYEYTIPTGFLYIEDIFVESGTANRYSPSGDRIDFRHWRVLPGSTPKVWIDNNLKSLPASRNLRLVGQAVQAQLATDAATCDINPAFLTFQAKALLHQSRIRGSGADFEEHQAQFQLSQAMADKERRHVQVAGRGRRVTV